VLPLAGLIGLHMLFSGQVRLPRGLAVGLAAGAASLLLTVACDSWFWQRWLWPEGEVLWFNTVLNRCAALRPRRAGPARPARRGALQARARARRSSEWGVSAWHWYWTSALPRALGPALPLALAGALLDRRAAQVVGVAAAYVALYSNLPHKEARPRAARGRRPLRIRARGGRRARSRQARLTAAPGRARSASCSPCCRCSTSARRRRWRASCAAARRRRRRAPRTRPAAPRSPPASC